MAINQVREKISEPENSHHRETIPGLLIESGKAIASETLPPCPKCGSLNIKKNGNRKLKGGTRKQRYQCRACGFMFC